MSARVSLQARVEQYLAERRKLGFALRSMGHGLPSFVRYVASAGHHGPLTVELMATWASQPKGGRGDRATSARRLKMLRPFTGWLRQFEPATEVPDEAVFGAVPGRMTPHVYREPEIIELLAGARKLGPDGGLRPLVMETLFGLIACTGLRISEALGLLDADVDLKDGVLTIRQSKFGKSRLVPLHPSAIEVLTPYTEFETVKNALEAAGLKPELAEVTMRADNMIDMAGDEAHRMQKLLDVLEDLDDTQNVFHNAEIS